MAKVAAGTACTGNDQCSSGVCDVAGGGHCCAAACSSVGGECGATGCDATGACVFPTTATTCMGVEKCDGSGHCVPGCGGATGSKCVFVSAAQPVADMGPVVAYDDLCGGYAAAAGLSGTFKAWLSDSTTSPSTRFTQPTVPYKNVAGQTVAMGWAGLTSGSLQTAILYDETGAAASGWAMTGTTAYGTATTNNCGDWIADGAATGTVGVPFDATAAWSNDANEYCGTQTAHLYCIEQ